jgi:hypothetical protein
VGKTIPDVGTKSNSGEAQQELRKTDRTQDVVGHLRKAKTQISSPLSQLLGNHRYHLEIVKTVKSWGVDGWKSRFHKDTETNPTL